VTWTNEPSLRVPSYPNVDGLPVSLELRGDLRMAAGRAKK